MTGRAADDVEQVFELELWGGATERRYRATRPEILAMPWGTLDTSALSADEIAHARLLWTTAAFQEHRTGAQCTAALRALFECRAPVDLIGMFSRFPLDEVAHVELAARMAMELGGAVELRHTTHDVVRDPEPAEPLLQAAELVVKVFCVGESLSIPLLHAAWQDARQPLPRAVLGRIVRDEAAHGVVGWTFLDWAEPFVSTSDKVTLGRHADFALGQVLKLWQHIADRRGPPRRANGIGWIGDARYLELAAQALASRVIAPLNRRGIPVSLGVLPEAVRAHVPSAA